MDKILASNKMHATIKTISYITDIKNGILCSWISDFRCLSCSFFAKRHVNSIAC